MADANYAGFNERLSRIDRNHRKAAHGYMQMVERDGIMVPRGRRVRFRRGIPFRGLFLLLAGFLLFKGFLLASLGAATYHDRLERLGEHNLVEQLGVWVMRDDPVTVWLAEQFALVI